MTDETPSLPPARLPIDRWYARIVSDRDDWSNEVIQACCTVGAVCERHQWQSARTLDPADVVIADAADPDEAKLELLERWAERAWQPICVVWITTEKGAIPFADALRSLGYRDIVQASADAGSWDDFQARTRNIVQTRMALVPMIAGALDCRDAPIVETLVAAVSNVPGIRTVERWAQEVGLKRREQLEERFAQRNLPRPKVVLEFVRIAKAVDYWNRLDDRPTVKELAAAFDYSSPDYFGERTRRLTGLPPRDLLTLGVEAVLASLRDRS